MSMFFIPVNPEQVGHVTILYWLLGERTPEQSISHKEMPSYTEHKAFVKSNPYKAWYLIATDEADEVVGATYITKHNEIGIAIFSKFKGNGLGKAAIKELMTLHDGPFLANINPANEPSLGLFESLGFKFIQVTYQHE